jgi:hypothetical protein
MSTTPLTPTVRRFLDRSAIDGLGEHILRLMSHGTGGDTSTGPVKRLRSEADVSTPGI